MPKHRKLLMSVGVHRQFSSCGQGVSHLTTSVRAVAADSAPGSPFRDVKHVEDGYLQFHLQVEEGGHASLHVTHQHR